MDKICVGGIRMKRLQWKCYRGRVGQAVICAAVAMGMMNGHSYVEAKETTQAETENVSEVAQVIREHGWKIEDGKVYYLDIEGNPVTGLQCIDNEIYYFQFDGSLYSGWVMLAEKTFYFDASGKLQRGDCVIDGESYHIEEDGEFIKGWYEKDGMTFYRDEHGFDQKGFIIVDGEKYYVNDNGLQKGIVYADEVYYTDESGRIYTGEVQVDGKKAYYDENGQFLKGWKKSEKGFTYYNENGVRLTGLQTIDGISYYFDENGVVITNKAVGMYWADSLGRLSKMELSEQTLNAALDEILAQTGKDITAIGQYVKGTLRYKYMGKLETREAMAVYALKNKRCSCYYYEALTGLLLERAGYQIKTIQGKGFVYSEHYWNLVYTTRNGVEGWYHVDALKGQYVKTDAEMVASGFKWEHANYPATP